MCWQSHWSEIYYGLDNAKTYSFGELTRWFSRRTLERWRNEGKLVVVAPTIVRGEELRATMKRQMGIC